MQDARESRENPGAPHDLRFQSEAIAIDVAKINFEYFINDGASTIPTEFERMWRDATELFSKLESEPLPECKTWIRQQLSTNVLDLALIFYHVNHSLPETEFGLVRKILSGLREKRLSRESMEFNDMVSEFIFFTATAVFCTENIWKSEALDKLDKLQFHSSLPFDESREKVFRQLAEQACKIT